MPTWLSNQIMRAFHNRDRRQIRLLNDCWFFYYNHQGPNTSSNHLHRSKS
ncbi:cortex morphogenetic protein CmpA [Paenibacillus sp. D2_2]|nr:cortex morphogenetic protein CmpA [Paenibacillus sp. D2_2]WMT39963.1 cortex morphogenetic protein CmpA [Paenibacillus sp. D2_2]